MSGVRVSRRGFLQTSVAGVSAWVAAGAARGKPSSAKASVVWHDVRDWGVEGKGWSDTVRFFDRLPRRAQGRVRPPVWSLSRHSAGLLVRFRTDAPAIHVRYRLLSGRLAMPHMPATGVSGLDLYAQDADGQDRWLAVVRPTSQQMETTLVDGVDPTPDGKPRRYTLYLPLYNGVESLEVGVDRAFRFEPIPPRSDKPLVFYGTSIMQGACASRPGMAFASILGRRLNRPVINLGFSGNGTMDAELGELMAELDAAVYVIDCLPNMTAQQVQERTEPLVRQLRAARPDVPIVLVEDRTYAYARFRKSARDRHHASRVALSKAFHNLLAAGVENLHYLEGEELLGEDGEATTDGSHPNDLGMVRYADAYEFLLRRVTEPASQQKA